MDLKVHRAILYLGMKRAGINLGKDLFNDFKPVWQGNWLTDMNQATALFSLFEKNTDHYKAYGPSGYHLPSLIDENKNEWIMLFNGLWNNEWINIKNMQEFKHIPEYDINISNTSQIGCYYPYDHFDVVDPLDEDGKPVSREKEEFNNAECITSDLHPDPPYYKLMTLTACEGVYKYCYENLLYFAYEKRDSSIKEKRDSSLRNLGHALHTLQDFFAHSNFVELLLSHAALNNMIDPDFGNILAVERACTFASYCNKLPPDSIPVMTGRFDMEDTLVSILKIYANHLVPKWSDLKAGGFALYDKPEKEEIIFNVLFGTFTNSPFAMGALKTAKTIFTISDFFDKIGNAIENGMIDLVGWLGKKITDEQYHSTIDMVKDYTKLVNSSEAKNYAKAGQLNYLIHVIESRLYKKLNDFQNDDQTLFQLPHHTLLAKDTDVCNPECRLAFKMACFFATEMTSDILHHYFSGQDYSTLKDELEKYYRHPVEILNDKYIYNGKLSSTVDALYGKRWWLHANESENRIISP